MRIVRLHRYAVRTYPVAEARLALEAPGKPKLEIAEPSVADDGLRGVWGPHELLIGSLASCFELTAVALARGRNVPIHAIRTDATGHVQCKDGLSHFVVLELDVKIQTDEGCEEEAESVAFLAHEQSAVAQALRVPIRLTVEAHAARRELVAV